MLLLLFPDLIGFLQRIKNVEDSFVSSWFWTFLCNFFLFFFLFPPPPTQGFSFLSALETFDNHRNCSKLDSSSSCVCKRPVTVLSSAVYQTDPVREAGSRLKDRRLGVGGPDRTSARQQEKVPERDQAHADPGQSAVPDYSDTEAAGRRIRWPQPEVTRAPRECCCFHLVFPPWGGGLNLIEFWKTFLGRRKHF